MENLNIVGPLLSSIIQMLLLVGAVAILFAALSVALGLSGSPALVAKPLMTRREEAMLVVLEELFPMYRFHAQVAMGALLKAPPRPGHRSSPADRNAFSQKILDFVVQDPHTGKIVALIEVEDWSHRAANRKCGGGGKSG